MKLLKCPICGNVVEMVEDHGVPLMCCGKKMEEVEAGAVDAALEKHVPVLKVEGDCLILLVKVVKLQSMNIAIFMDYGKQKSNYRNLHCGVFIFVRI